MERLYALYQHWSWLPHFRAIAETQHLGMAARLLHVTPPALSRALRQLESALDVKLFERRGRNLVLNDAGAELLSAVRDAMRHVDDAVTRVATTRLTTHVRVSAPGPYYAAVVLPALARLRKSWSHLRGELVESPASIPAALLRGDVDVCLHEHVVASEQIEVTAISRVQKVVACAPTHRAARKRRLHVDGLTAYEFVGPPANDSGVRNDGWPGDVVRHVGLTVANMQLGVDAAASGGYLAVLPLPIVRGTGLVALTINGLTIPPTTVYASRRRSLSRTSDAPARVVEQLRAELRRSQKH